MAIFNIDAEAPATDADAKQNAPTDSPPEVSAKRRGRPPKSANGATNTLPETPVTGDSPPRVKRKRKAKPIDAALLSKQIVGLHKVAATMTGLRELEISEFEAVMLAESLAAVSREYDVTLDGKVAATIQLAAAIGVIYVPRLVMIKKRAAQAKALRDGSADAASGAPENVTPQASASNADAATH